MNKPPTRIQIDVSGALNDFLDACETYCIVGCCGMDAFELSEADVRAWIERVGLSHALEAAKQLQDVLQRIRASKADQIVFTRFECCLTQAEANHWFVAFADLLGLAGVPPVTRQEASTQDYPNPTEARAVIRSELSPE